MLYGIYNKRIWYVCPRIYPKIFGSRKKAFDIAEEVSYSVGYQSIVFDMPDGCINNIEKMIETTPDGVEVIINKLSKINDNDIKEMFGCNRKEIWEYFTFNEVWKILKVYEKKEDKIDGN